MTTEHDLARWRHSLAPAFLWDARRERIAWANAAAVNWFGAASLGDLVERAFGERDPAVRTLRKAADELLARKPRRKDDGEPRALDLAFSTAGHDIPLPFHAYPHALPGGHTGLFLVASNPMVETIAASRPAMLLEILRDLPAAIAVVDATGALIFANSGALELMEESRLAGLAAFFASQADAQAFLLRAIQAGAAVQTMQVDTRLGRRLLRLTARAARDGELVVLTLDDLTERMAAEHFALTGLWPATETDGKADPAHGTSAPLPREDSISEDDRKHDVPGDDASLHEAEVDATREGGDSMPEQRRAERETPVSSTLSQEELAILRRIADTLANANAQEFEITRQEEAPRAPGSDRKGNAGSPPVTPAADAPEKAMPRQPATGDSDHRGEEPPRTPPGARSRITIRRRSSTEDAPVPPASDARETGNEAPPPSPHGDEAAGKEERVPPCPNEEETPGLAANARAAHGEAGDDRPVDGARATDAEETEEAEHTPRPDVPMLVRQVMDHNPEPIILHRANAFYYANKAARDLLGYALEDTAWDEVAGRLMEATDGGKVHLGDARGRQLRFRLRRDAFPWQDGVVVQSTLAPLDEEPDAEKGGGHQKDDATARHSRRDREHDRKASGGGIRGDGAARAAAEISRRQAADVIRLHVAGGRAAQVRQAQESRQEPKEEEKQLAEAMLNTPAPESGVAETDDELRALLDTATDGIMTLNADGRILSFSTGAEHLFGYRAGEIIGHALPDLFAGKDHQAISTYLEEIRRGAAGRHPRREGREITGLTKSGEEIPLFLTIGRLRHDRMMEHKDHASFCVVVRDLSSWKRKESELLRAKEEAERASAQKSEFLAMISHELRTPLNAILGFSDVLRQQMFGKLGNEKYLDYARDIYESGEHLLALINDLLDLSKIEAGHFELDFVEVDAVALVEEVLHTMREQIAASGVEVRRSLPRRLPRVVADVRAMKQIMFNLVSNAIKFCRKGDLVTIALSQGEDGSVELVVSDTGPGMSAEELKNALEPFRRVKREGHQAPGTGLGLPLTKALAEANKALFSIDSEPGRGTRVRITFPPHRVLA